jgi:2-keto-4-pentenoate hydratase/2-oxohepta-3-ene-1,7-dioic acid hydratase in catechol pathway
MKLVTIDAPGGGRAGALIGDDILDLGRAAPAIPIAAWIPASVRRILEGGDEGLDIVRRVVDKAAGGKAGIAAQLCESGALTPASATKLMAPIPDPSCIWSCGMNYGEHLKEMNTPIPDQPTGFVKSSNAIIGPGAPIVLPKQCPEMVDFEGEFSFVIGRECHNVSEAEAMDYVAGYTIVNDVSARDWVAGVFAVSGTMPAIHAWELNILGKQLPTFSPMGPVMVTRDEIKDPHDLDLKTTLNGQVMQSTNTDDLVFGLPRLIAHFSRWMRFRPGDVFTTGSPSGVGYGRKPKLFMKAGDTVAVTVEGVGTLSNPIVAPRS